MGLQLTFQLLQVCLRQLCLKLEGTKVPVLEPLLIPHRMCDQYPRQICRKNVVHYVVKEQPLKQDPLDTEGVGVRVPHSVCVMTDARIPDRIYQTPEDHVCNCKR